MNFEGGRSSKWEVSRWMTTGAERGRGCNLKVLTWLWSGDALALTAPAEFTTHECPRRGACAEPARRRDPLTKPRPRAGLLPPSIQPPPPPPRPAWSVVRGATGRSLPPLPPRRTGPALSLPSRGPIRRLPSRVAWNAGLLEIRGWRIVACRLARAAARHFYGSYAIAVRCIVW